MQKSFYGKVLERFMSVQELADFEAKYKANRTAFGSKEIQKPTELQFKIAEDWSLGVRPATLRGKYNMTASAIESSLNRVARWNLRHGNTK